MRNEGIDIHISSVDTELRRCEQRVGMLKPAGFYPCRNATSRIRPIRASPADRRTERGGSSDKRETANALRRGAMYGNVLAAGCT